MIRSLQCILAIFFVFPSVLLGCTRQPSPSIHMGVRTANDHAPFYLADKLGFYADQGLDVNVHIMPSNTEIIEAVQRGDIQAGAVPVTTAIAAISAGARIKIVAMTGRGSDGLLVRQDAGIQSIDELYGKRVATIRGSILDVPLRHALQQNGLDPDSDVEMIYFTKLGDMLHALQTNQVDAASNTEPFLTQAERQGWGKVLCYYSEAWPDHPCCVLFVSNALIDTHPEHVADLVRAHVRAVAYANSHLQETAQVIVEYLNAFDQDLVRASLAPDKMRIDYDLHREEIDRMASLMYQYGLLERQITSQELLDLSYLEAVR